MKNASLAIETSTTESNGKIPAVDGNYTSGKKDLKDAAGKVYGQITITKDNTITITVDTTNNTYTIKGTNSNVTGNGSVCTYSSDTGSISWGGSSQNVTGK